MRWSGGMTAKALVADRVRVTTPGGGRLVDDVSLRLAPGEVVGLTGPSGGGKSTLAWALLGLARPPLAVTGTVTVGGQALEPAMRGRDIALVVQNPRAALHPMIPVGRQIGRIWRAHHKGSEAEAKARAIGMLKLVGINDAERRADAFAHELSGGMAQRALIAAALAAEPAVLIADEPTSGLDVTVQAAFLDMMWRTTRERGTAMLLVTQEPGILANYCDRVLVMEGGRIVQDRPATAHFAGVATAKTAPPIPLSPADPVIAAEGLVKRFPVRGRKGAFVRAVDHIDLAVMPGETLGLVGESGSGKTTAGRALIRLIEADAGNIRLAGNGAFRRRVQLVRQDPFDSFDPRWTIRRSLAEPLRAHGLDAGDAKIDALLALVGCAELAVEARPRDLPAGTLQRLAIARALATEPDFIVLDEPTSVLTPDARAELVALLREVQARTGAAFLFISHDLTTVAAISHRVAVMYLGQIVEEGETARIFAAPRHPYTRALIAAHLSEDPHDRRVDRPDPARLEGEIPSPIDLPPGCALATRCPHVMDRCRSERQELRAVAGGLVRCWRAEELGA
jgi:peptide/nickel transport system ATP-binding protein